MGSPAYILTGYNNGIGMLERCMLDIFETETDAYLLIMGDFNVEPVLRMQSIFKVRGMTQLMFHS